MRIQWFGTLLLALLAAGAGRIAAAQDVEQQDNTLLADPIKELFKPDAFPTLVNPACSHCVDEAKRRAAELRDDDRVLAWTRGNYEGGAIPLRFFLVPYRVISDTYGVFVYDADAGYARGFAPSLDFTFHGWRNGIMVIKHKDGTLFSALSGGAFAGPRQGEKLEPVATIQTDWGYWNRAYAGSVAYHMFEKYQPRDLPDEPDPDSLRTRLPVDARLEATQTVLGVELAGEARAYPIADLEKAGGIIHDKLADEHIVLLWYEPTKTAAVYTARLDPAPRENEDENAEQDTRQGQAESDPGLLEFEYDPQSPEAPFVDRQTGSRWGVEGRAHAGPLDGRTLRWLPGVQCYWFAWAAEYPETTIHSGARRTSDDRAPSPRKQAHPAPRRSQSKRARSVPRSAVIVEPGALTRQQADRWANEGYQAAAVVLDAGQPAAIYESAAQAASHAGLALYYWLEVGRNPSLADQHPEWMASLGMHDDWKQRFPDVGLPGKGQVAKAYPWVPIGYRPGFDAHLAHIQNLLQRAAGDYQGLLLNDLQGGPAACGCGNLQCRWALDYGVASTAEKLEGDDVAARFVSEVARLVPDKQVVPVWMTECEDQDLPPDTAPGGRTTGYCGSVACSRSTCPKAFTSQWTALVQGHDGPIGILATHEELGRENPQWVQAVVEYLDQVPTSHKGQRIGHERLWLVVQGYGLDTAAVEAARSAAVESGAAAVFVAMTRIDQSYEPRIVDLQ